MMGPGRLEFLLDDGARFFVRHGNADRDLEVVFACGEVREGEKPDHARVYHREFFGSQVGENSEQGVLARGWIDIDGIAGDPCEDLWFR